MSSKTRPSDPENPPSSDNFHEESRSSKKAATTARVKKPIGVETDRAYLQAALDLEGPRDQSVLIRITRPELRLLTELATLSNRSNTGVLRALIHAGHRTMIDEPARLLAQESLTRENVSKELDKRVMEIATMVGESSSRGRL